MPPSGDEAPSPPPDSLINQSSARAYWAGVSADVTGMLGGFPEISVADLDGSRAFLAALGIGGRSGGGSESKDGGGVERALEGGAGIGRITTGLLTSVARTVDIIEPIGKFTRALAVAPGVGDVFPVGLESWRPQTADGTHASSYGLIWNQWCVGHLTDAQLEAYLRRCVDVLAPAGFIVVKENLSSAVEDIYDEEDNSVTRTDDKFRAIFAKAGLVIVKTELQKGFPKGLFKVRSYALRPAAERAAATAATT